MTPPLGLVKQELESILSAVEDAYRATDKGKDNVLLFTERCPNKGQGSYVTTLNSRLVAQEVESLCNQLNGSKNYRVHSYDSSKGKTFLGDLHVDYKEDHINVTFKHKLQFIMLLDDDDASSKVAGYELSNLENSGYHSSSKEEIITTLAEMLQTELDHHQTITGRIERVMAQLEK